jgi:hypothetical protein
MKGEKMNSLVRKLIVVAFTILVIANITAAQSKSQPNEPRPSQVGLAKSALEARSSEPVPSTFHEDKMYEDMMHEDYGMMMEMEMMGMGDAYRLPMTGRKVFIVPTDEIEIEDYVAIERDIEVMSLIFDRALKKPQMIGGVFTVMEDFFGRNSHVTEAIYLDGYGALFFLEVNFTLFGSSESEQKEAPKEVEEHVDQIWKRAEQELYSPQELRNRGSGSSREYDPEKVENLKATLVTVLKHAANIKALKSDEFVVLMISGKAPPRSSRVRAGALPNGRDGRSRAVRRDHRTTRGTRSMPTKIIPFARTVVNIRAKKADIDAYSKSELDFNKFHERVQIFTHYR